MNELKVLGTEKIGNFEFTGIEGGFGENKKAMLVKDIATIHDRPVPDEKRYVIVMGYSKMTEADHPNSEIKIGVNMQSAGVSVDPTKVVTRLIPLGATIDDKSETKQRYMLWSGKDNYRFEDGFVKSNELEKTFGIIYGTQVWSKLRILMNLDVWVKNGLLDRLLLLITGR